MKKLCVFTGAAVGSDPRFAEAAHQLGQILTSRNLGLVYGGGKSGLMGKIADMSAIQCRRLNESKGYAVQSTRFQVDKSLRFYLIHKLRHSFESN